MTIEKLLAEQKSLEGRKKRLAEQYHATTKRLEVIQSTIRRMEERARLEPLIGVPGGVRNGFRRASHEKDAWMNDALGTLLKLNRSYAEVDYGERGEWRIPFFRLIPAIEEQGGTFAAMASGEWI